MRKEFYITTPIYYVNDKPHVGHAYTNVATDAIARWRRAQGDDVFFLTGTDEHGTKNQRSAEKVGEETQGFVDKIADKFKDLKEVLDLSWDFFIRTSDKEIHWPGAQALWKKLEEVGDIYWKDYEGFYCVGCEAFVTEKDLVDDVCPDHKTKPELIKEKNLYFKLSKYSKQIEKAIETGELNVQPETRRNEILAFIRGGLEDVSFSRPKDKLKWGVPVPDHEDQVMYVWCDALSNYISAIGYGRDEKEFNKWWPADVHVIGKDILRFHAAIWPGMLLSAGLPLPKSIFVHGFITSEGEKMSKTIGNVIDPFEVVEEFGSDAFRYYLLREIPSDEDGDFSIDKFKERYNADLANGLGNFASRVTTLAEKAEGLAGLLVDEEIQNKITETAISAAKEAERFKLHEVTAKIWALIKFGDGYINKHKPWETDDAQVIFNLLALLDAIASFASPIVPKAAGIIQKSIKKEDGKIIGAQKVVNLFPRLDA
ncbi:methionine--tRNA ligase [Patescibacteria group bacterium]|nr:methionine--tRNA ligase [Patescibacteria group bacterium]